MLKENKTDTTKRTIHADGADDPLGKYKTLVALLLIVSLYFIPAYISKDIKGHDAVGIVLPDFKLQKRCLIEVLYAETRSEGIEGMKAVLSVIINRKHSSKFPSTFCGVVDQPRQFSYHNAHPRGYRLDISPVKPLDKQAYTKVAYLADQALLGVFKPTLEPSVLYYANFKIKNHWTTKMKKVKIINKHAFFAESDLTNTKE